MAQTNYTPISLYYSATASATPTAGNLVAGELALNTNDGKLFYKDSSGVVQTLASKAGNVNVSSFSAGSTGLTPSTATTGAVTLAGTLNVANGGTGLTTLTAGYIPYGNGTSAFSSSSNLYFSGTNLGIGTSSPQVSLEIKGYLNLPLRVYGKTGVQYNGVYSNFYYNGSTWVVDNPSYGANGISLTETGSIQFYTAPAGGSTSSTLQATLDTSGNLGLGVTPSAWNTYKAMQINSGGGVMGTTNGTSLIGNWYYNSGYKYINTASATLFDTSNGAFQWYTAPSGTAGNAITFTQAMTLDNSGRLLIGTTTPSLSYGSGLVAIKQSGDNGIQIEMNSNNSGIAINQNTTGGTYFQVFGYKSTTVGSIQTNGTTTSYNITSDQRLKTNIVDAPTGNIDYIKVRSFDWKSNGSHQTYGFIAQELIEVAPYAVHQPQDTNEMMAVDYSKLVPMMIKEIQDLKQRIATLENK